MLRTTKKKWQGTHQILYRAIPIPAFLFGCYILGYHFSTKLRDFATFKTPEVDHLPCGMTEPSGETGVGFKRLWIGMISNRLPKLRL